MVKEMRKAAQPGQRLTQGNSFPAERCCTELPCCLNDLHCGTPRGSPAAPPAHEKPAQPPGRPLPSDFGARGCFPIVVIFAKDGDEQESRNYSFSYADARSKEMLRKHCRDLSRQRSERYAQGIFVLRKVLGQASKSVYYRA